MSVIKVSDLKDTQVEELKLFIEKGATREQAKEYGLALFNNIDLSKIDDLSLSAKKMREIRLGEQDGLQTDLYRGFDEEKMAEIRYGLTCAKQDERDISKYVDYSVEQLKVINDGYNNGLTAEQVDWYANESYNASVMKKIMDLIKAGHIEKETDIPDIAQLESDDIKMENTLEEVIEELVVEETEPEVVEEVEEVVEETEMALDETINAASVPTEEEKATASNTDFDLGDLSDYFDIG